jgi:hypothetical protein
MIYGVTEALVILRQRFVDMSCRDCGVAGSNCDLVEIRYDISRSIDTVDRRPLMGIYLEASNIVRLSTHGDHKFGSNSAAERWIDDVEGKGLTTLQNRPDIVFAMFDVRDRPPNFYAGFAERLGRFLIFVVKTEQCDITRIRAQKFGLARRVLPMTEDTDPLIRRLVPVTDRAVSYRTVCDRLLDTGQVGAFVDDACGQQDEPRLHLLLAELGGEFPAFSLQFSYRCADQRDAVGFCLLAQRPKQARS